MGIGSSIFTCLFRKYLGFSGRASRKEYWSFAIFALGLIVGPTWVFWNFYDILVCYLPPYIMSSDFSLLLDVSRPLLLALFFLPFCAVQVRRLHDINKSGWWIFISLVPAVGNFMLFFLSLGEGTSGSNSYGPDPRVEDREKAAREKDAMQQTFPEERQHHVTGARPASQPEYIAPHRVSNNSDFRRRDMRSDCVNHDRRSDC